MYWKNFKFFFWRFGKFFQKKNRNIATDHSILFFNFHISAKFHTQRKHCDVLASQQEQMLLLNITNCSWSWSLHAMWHRRVWVVRFSQPAIRNVQKGIRAVRKCQGRKICNITGELLSNSCTVTLARCSLQLVMQKKPPWRIQLGLQLSAINWLPNFQAKI